MKFYPTDHRSDEQLRMCGAAARGLWMEMICIMHSADPYGHLLVSGEAPNDTQLAVLTGIPTDQLPGLLAELEKYGVFSRNQKRVIYSRRMVRDEKKAAHAAKIGELGGNPSLSKTKGKSGQDNPKYKPPDKRQDNVQTPEAREKKEKQEKEKKPEAVFCGEVIQLTQGELDEWCELSGLSEDKLLEILRDRDRFYVEKADPRARVNWRRSTETYLKKFNSEAEKDNGQETKQAH